MLMLVRDAFEVVKSLWYPFHGDNKDLVASHVPLFYGRLQSKFLAHQKKRRPYFEEETSLNVKGCTGSGKHVF
jgi:hypothetical protein